jgi:ABC-type uncharacterized transport system YnjBCD permease subunit
VAWLCSASLGAVICLLWLASGPSRFDGWIWLPLVLPALPLVDGQYQLALYTWLDGEWVAVLWGHLLWVVPWMLFILRPAWRARDPRMELLARTLGWQRGRIFWLVTLPALTRPLLTALAVGFSVSIAQYLPTLWLGADGSRRSPAKPWRSAAAARRHARRAGAMATTAAGAVFCRHRPAGLAGRPLSTRITLMLTVKI